MKRIKIYIEEVHDSLPGKWADLVISVVDPLSEADPVVISRGSFHEGDSLVLWASALPESARIVVTPQPPPRLWKKPTLWDWIVLSYEAMVDWWWSVVPDLEDPDGR